MKHYEPKSAGLKEAAGRKDTFGAIDSILSRNGSQLFRIIAAMVVDISFSPKHEEKVATAVAHCDTLVDFVYAHGASRFFFNHYCIALSKNHDTKLQRLLLQQPVGRPELGG